MCWCRVLSDVSICSRSIATKKAWAKQQAYVTFYSTTLIYSYKWQWHEWAANIFMQCLHYDVWSTFLSLPGSCWSTLWTGSIEYKSNRLRKHFHVPITLSQIHTYNNGITTFKTNIVAVKRRGFFKVTKNGPSILHKCVLQLTTLVPTIDVTVLIGACVLIDLQNFD